jgi:hypothetical protein
VGERVGKGVRRRGMRKTGEGKSEVKDEYEGSEG